MSNNPRNNTLAPVSVGNSRESQTEPAASGPAGTGALSSEDFGKRGEREDFRFGKEEKLRRMRISKHARKGQARIPHVMISGVEHKSCGSCGSLKPLSEFWNESAKVDGKRPCCKKCDQK